MLSFVNGSRRPYMVVVIGIIGMAIVGVLGWQTLSVTEGDTLDCEYNPFGVGYWASPEGLSEFSDADLVAKVMITGHEERADEYLTYGDHTPAQEEVLIHQATVLDILKGMPSEETISIASASGICFPEDKVLYLYLTKPIDKYETAPTEFQDNPDEYQPPEAYYVLSPYAQFPVRDDKIQVYEPFVEHDKLPGQFDGMPEAEFRQVLEGALDAAPQ